MTEKSKLERAHLLADIIGKLLIPVVVVFITVIWNRHQNTFLEAKSKHDLDVKYTEIFYNDITSDDPQRVRVAEAVLREVNPELQVSLSRALRNIDPARGLILSAKIASDPTQTKLVRSAAQDIAFQIAQQFHISAPHEGDPVAPEIQVRGITPFQALVHYLVVTPQGAGDFLIDMPLSIASNGAFSGPARLGSMAMGGGQAFSIRAIAVQRSLSPDQIRKHEIPQDALSSNSVTVFRSNEEEPK